MKINTKKKKVTQISREEGEERNMRMPVTIDRGDGTVH